MASGFSWPCRGFGPPTFENPWFFTFFNSPARPSADFGLVDLRKLVVFCDFQITRATLCGLSAGRPSKTRGFLRFSNRSRGPLRSFAWSNRSRCGAALIFLKLRTLNRCRASGICSRAFLARAPNRGQAIGIASEALLILRKLVFFFDFQFARATLCGVWAGRPSKARGFLRFSNRSRDPLRSFAWSNRSRCGAALPKPLPSQWDLHQISCELETIAKPWELLLKRFSPSTSARLNSALLARLNLLRQTLAMKLSTQELYFRSFLRPNPRSCG